MDKDSVQTNPTEMIIMPPVKSKNILNVALGLGHLGWIQSIRIPQESGHFLCDFLEVTA